MSRVGGVDLPREKRMEIALTYIYGIGRTRAVEALAATEIDLNKRAKDLTDEELVQLRDYIEGNFKVEGDLRREVAADIRRKVEIGSHQGLRHRRGLPGHGQPQRREAQGRREEEGGQEVVGFRGGLRPPRAPSARGLRPPRPPGSPPGGLSPE